MKLGNIVANLENLSEEGQLGATEAAMNAAETATDVAEGNAEVIKDVAEIDSTDTAIEDAFEAEDKIENLLDAAEETMKEGGMSEKEAKLLEISHESIMSSIGMGHRHSGLTANPVLSQESYASAQTRGAATLATIESLKDSASKIGTGIISALKAALNAVVGFLLKLVRNRAVLEKHLTNLQKQVAAVKDETKKKDRITAGAAALTVGGEASVETAKKLLASADKMIDASSEIATAIKDKPNTENAADVIKSAVNKIGPLTSGRTVKVEEKDGTVTVTVDGGAKTAEDIAAPSKAEMNTLLTQAIAVVRKLREFEKTQTKLKDGVAKFIDLLKEGYNKVAGKAGSADNQMAGVIRANARQARSMMSKAGGTFPGAAFQAAKAVGDYVAGGLRNFGEKAEAAPAAK